MSEHLVLWFFLGLSVALLALCWVVGHLVGRTGSLEEDVKRLRKAVGVSAGQRTSLESASAPLRPVPPNDEKSLPREYPSYRDQLEVKRAAERILKRRHERERALAGGGA